MNGPAAAPLALRHATLRDVPQLHALIARSVMELQSHTYSEDLRRAAIGDVFGVDPFLVQDHTYYLAELGNVIVGCGGWSARRSLCGANQDLGEGDNPLLDPAVDPARIRAFFTDPLHARRGIGKALLRVSETAALNAGFRRGELVATLAGEPFYVSQGYEVLKRFELPLKNGLRMPVVQMGKMFA